MEIQEYDVIGCVSCLRKNITKKQPYILDLNDPPEQYEDIDTPFKSMPLNQKVVYINKFLTCFPTVNCWFVEFVLTECYLSKAQAADLGNIISKSPLLEVINLSHNEIDDSIEIAQFVLPPICALQRLRFLDLGNNQMGTVCFLYLSNHAPSSLNHLRLEKNVPEVGSAMDPVRKRELIKKTIDRTPLLKFLSVDEVDDVSGLCHLEYLNVNRITQACLQSTWCLPGILSVTIDGIPINGENLECFNKGKKDIVKWMIELRRAGMSKDGIENLLTF